MTVTLSLPPEMEKKLQERAAASGDDVAGFVHRLIEKELTSSARRGLAREARQGIMSDLAVFDCMVFLQAAARTEGPAAACLELVRRGKIDLVTHPEILKEIGDVLTRPKVLAKFPPFPRMPSRISWMKWISSRNPFLTFENISSSSEIQRTRSI